MRCDFFSRSSEDRGRVRPSFPLLVPTILKQCYINVLKNGNLYDSCVLKSGADYAEKLKGLAEEVETVVAPMFK